MTLGILSALPVVTEAFTDDFEEEFWLPFTHFHLGDFARAEYSRAFSRSGDRSYHVAITGWAVRDFGSAYGYAVYATRGAPITEIRLALLYERLQDTELSPWNAFAAGVGIELLDASFQSVGRYRYLTAYQSSLNGGRCGPVSSDIVLGTSAVVGTWTDLARSPAADFPSALWPSAEYVKISVGFLCGAGLTGASYSMYFDNFLIDSGSGDGDEDGLSNLEEETRIYVARISATRVPSEVPSGGQADMAVQAPPLSAVPLAAAIAIEIDHLHPDALSVAVEIPSGESTSHLLWDPGFHYRGSAILTPAAGESVRGQIEVRGRVSSIIRDALVEFYVDDQWTSETTPESDDSFAVSWDTDASEEGPHRLYLVVQGHVGAASVERRSPETSVTIDRTPPEVQVRDPADGSQVSGLVVVDAQAFDAERVASVELFVDGMPYDTRYAEPFSFPFETLDVPNGIHSIGVVARDAVGNRAESSVQVDVNNQVTSVPPPCLPACIFDSGTGGGDLPPLSIVADPFRVALMSGDVLETFETLRVPWRAQVGWRPGGVSLVLDLLREAETLETQGLVAPSISPDDLGGIREWRFVVAEHAGSGAGTIRAASILLAGRTSPARADSDGDGIPDGDERLRTRTLPILPDHDEDGLADGDEVEPRGVFFDIDEAIVFREIRTDPLDPDTDGDGLSDGRELLPGEGLRPSDPTDPDTDLDGLADGLERDLHGTDPTRSDTDGEGLSDFEEVQDRVLALLVNGVLREYTYRTSPLDADTDGDLLTDFEEELGTLGDTVTHPGLSDTDEDGLVDGEEVRVGKDGFVTRALSADSDEDGVWDVFDRLPLEQATLAWHSVYPPGLIRFSQDVHVVSIHGTMALVTRRVEDFGSGTYTCVLEANDIEASTRSSGVSAESIISSINRMFSDGGETRFQAKAVGDDDTPFSQHAILHETFGSCGPNEVQYDLEYEIREESYRVDFENVQDATVEDDSGRMFEYSVVLVPVDPGVSVSLVLQLSLPEADDRTGFQDEFNWRSLAVSFVVFGSSDFSHARLLHSGLAFATDLNEHAYRVELRIPGKALDEEFIEKIDGVPTVALYLSPQWVGAQVGNPIQEAVDASQLGIAALSLEQTNEVYDLLVRFGAEDPTGFLEAADSLAGLPTGLYEAGGRSVYVFQTGGTEVFDANAPIDADVVLLSGETEADLFAARDSIDWGAEGTWYQQVVDPLGNLVRAFRDSVKIVRTAVVLSQQGQLLLFRFVDPGSYTIHADPEFLIILEKAEVDGSPIYVISTAESEQHFLFDVSESGNVVVRRQGVYRITSSEVVTDLSTSRTLANRWANIKLALRNLNAGAVLVTNGYEAIIAFRQGDELRGLVYSSNAGLGLLGVFKGNVALSRLFPLQGQRFLAIRVGTLANAASGALIAGYELHQGLTSSNEILRRIHFERSAAVAIDTAISIVPIYGPAFLLSWTFTNLLFSRIMPDPLAARITSSPGSVIAFLFEYFLTGSVPGEIANKVLSDAIDISINIVESNSGVFRIPSVPVFP
ncbi:MAG TPA: Ig-like domain-containing protein [Thermoplasmata archaeon]|nr:Ig-like domain-containing protein [Thermoplasmata archaeon]